MRKHKAIENYEHICFKCLQEKPIKKYSLYRMNYGSSFDNNYTYLQICKDCEPKDIGEWFNEEPERGEWGEHYEYEQNIIDFVNTLPIEGQELFWARCSYGACSTDISGQDWIDMHSEIMPDERYEELGYYSPRQKQAYKERFPICQHPVNKIYEDDSKGCWCPFGANGKYGQRLGLNISDECFECEYYAIRQTPIRDILDEDWNDYKIYIKAKMNMDKYIKKFK